MKVEAFRCWNDKTWDTDTIEIDMEYPEKIQPEDHENIEVLIQEHYQACTGMAFCGIYHVPEPEECS